MSACPANALWRGAYFLFLCDLSSITSGQRFAEPRDLVVGDLGEDPCQPSVRIDFVELNGFEEG